LPLYINAYKALIILDGYMQLNHGSIVLQQMKGDQTMKQLLMDVEKSLCEISSMVSLVRLSDYDTQAIEIDNVLQLAEEMIDNARTQLAYQIVLISK